MGWKITGAPFSQAMEPQARTEIRDKEVGSRPSARQHPNGGKLQLFLTPKREPGVRKYCQSDYVVAAS